MGAKRGILVETSGKGVGTVEVEASGKGVGTVEVEASGKGVGLKLKHLVREWG